MSMSITFDTLKFLERLKASGVPETQAKAQTEALADVLTTGAQELATKQDVAELRRDLKELEVSLQRDMKEQEYRMTIKLGGMILAGIGLLFGLMRAWPMPVQYVPPAAPPAMSAPFSPAQR